MISFQVIFIRLVLVIKVAQSQENVCRTVKDYYSMSGNPNCWFDFTANATSDEIIRYSGRPVEEHKAVTEDGYILTMFRIPRTNEGRNVSVFIQHGVFATSDNFVILLNDSLAFQLFDNGYDVWLGNYRGNQYSNRHTKYNENDDAFWDYSMDDVALKDLPAMFKKVTEVTGRKQNIVYIGHSLGCTFSLMYTSEKPEESMQYLKMQILAAPAYTLRNMRNPLTLLVPFTDMIYSAINFVPGLAKVISKEKTSKGILKLLCTESGETRELCARMYFSVIGTKTGILPEKYPAIANQHPSGTAWKLIRQMADLPMGHFRKFDYGFGNMKMYGSMNSPNYDISRIKLPTTVLCAKNDWLTSKLDAINLYRGLPANIRNGLYEVRDEYFNHMDFVFGSTSKILFVDKVLEIINNNL